MRIKLFMILLVAATFLSGCWDVEEVNRRAIVNAIYIDRGESHKFKLGAVFHVPGSLVPPVDGTEQQFQKRYFTLSGEGDSLLEAWTGVQQNTSRSIFFGQLRAIILSEEVVKNNINDLMNYISRVRAVPSHTEVLVTRSDPEKLLEMPTNTNFIPGDYVDQFEQSPYKNTRTILTDLWKVYEIVDNKTGDVYLPVINASQKCWKIEGTALFSQNRLVGFLNSDETGTLSLLKGSKSGFLSVPLGNNKVLGFDQVNSESRIKPEIRKNGIVTYKIDNKINGELAETNPEFIHLSSKDRLKLEAEIEKYVEKKSYRLLNRLQMLNSDPAGFGGKFRIRYPETWEKINWHKVYPGAKFIVNTDFTIKGTGLYR